MAKLLTEKCKDILFTAFLATVPLFYIMGLDLRIVQEQYFQTACMALGALFFGNIWLTLFLWLNLILFAVHGADVGSSQVLSIFLTGILFACSRSFFSTRDFSKYSKAISWLAVLSILFMIMQVFGVDPISVKQNSYGIVEPNQTVNELNGIMHLPAFNGMFLTIAASLIVFYSWIGLLLVVPVIFTKCSAAILAFSLLIIFYAYHKARKLIIPFILLASVLFVGYLSYDKKHDSLTFMSRFENWHLMIRKTLEMPLGYGPDSFSKFHKHKNFLFSSDEDYNPILRVKISENEQKLLYYSADMGKKIQRFKGRIPKLLPSWTEAHNEYIELFFQYGIFGVLIFLGFSKEIYDRFVLSDKDKTILSLLACLLVYSALSVTQFPFHLARISGIIGIILGAYWAVTDKSYTIIKEKAI